MTGLCWPLLALAAVGAAFGLWQWFQRRRTLRRLGDMLDRAIAGGFAEERFDETELSALEGKLARFLRGSAHAQKTLEGEQAAVKALVADISHQTRTPISNLLLYASLLLESDLSPICFCMLRFYWKATCRRSSGNRPAQSWRRGKSCLFSSRRW